MRWTLFRPCFLLLLILPGSFTGRCQSSLRQGFDGQEYLSMLRIAFTRQDSLIPDIVSDNAHVQVNAPANYVRQYRSPELGLKNRWDLWSRRDGKVDVICIRGTINDAVSWLANFYAAMVPATGSLQLNDSTTFSYQLSADDKALVHVGWLVSLGYLAPTMVQQIRAAYAKGVHEFIITGHSQGGAIAFLTTSYLHYLIGKGELPGDILFKTYCSAGPKPGNLYYAYDYDFITRNGWGFNVINAADWVPESPTSIQTLSDYNPANPFMHVSGLLKKQPWYIRWYIKGKFNKMDRLTHKAERYYRSTLGDLIYKQVKKTLRDFTAPQYAESSNYQRAGVPIVLEPDAAYYKQFGNDPQKVFQHHMYEAYYWLASQYYGK